MLVHLEMWNIGSNHIVLGWFAVSGWTDIRAGSLTEVWAGDKSLEIQGGEMGEIGENRGRFGQSWGEWNSSLTSLHLANAYQNSAQHIPGLFYAYHCIVMYCIVLYCTAMHCTALHSTGIALIPLSCVMSACLWTDWLLSAIARAIVSQVSTTY